MRPSIVIITEDRYSDVTMSLVKRVVTLQDAWNALTVDERPFQLGGLPAVSGRHRDQWMNKLRAAAKRRNCAGVLFVMDGDQDKFENQ